MLPNPSPYFAELTDPRRETKNKLHKLNDILMIVLCSVLSGIEDWVGMEEFAREKESWFRQFLELPNGVPSHDTLSDVMGRVHPQKFIEAFTAWVHVGLPSLSGEQVCVDGKSLRGSRDGDKKAVHVITAFAAKARMVLTQQAVPEKTNEITGIPDVLSMIDLTGALVSIDAMGCQKEIAKQIVNAKADYLLALKENHVNLYDDVTLWLNSESKKLKMIETVEKGHGRIEIRKYILSDQIAWLEQKPLWKGLTAVGRVESTRIIGETSTTEYRYYLCSFTGLERFAEAARGHWAIENTQHWVLDVQFAEDLNRSRKDRSPENLALVRRMALNIIRMNGPSKQSLRIRKLKAALNDDYRYQLIFGGSAS